MQGYGHGKPVLSWAAACFRGVCPSTRICSGPAKAWHPALGKVADGGPELLCLVMSQLNGQNVLDGYENVELFELLLQSCFGTLQVTDALQLSLDAELHNREYDNSILEYLRAGLPCAFLRGTAFALK